MQEIESSYRWQLPVRNISPQMNERVKLAIVCVDGVKVGRVQQFFTPGYKMKRNEANKGELLYVHCS
jgi:hypothetical protein